MGLLPLRPEQDRDARAEPNPSASAKGAHRGGSEHQRDALGQSRPQGLPLADGFWFSQVTSHPHSMPLLLETFPFADGSSALTPPSQVPFNLFPA